MTSSDPPPIVDAHHHLWDSTKHAYPYLTDGSRDRMHGKPLPRVYVIDDFLADIAGSNVVKSVHVQCGWNPADPVGETAWVQAIADRHGYPHGIVGHADLAHPAVDEVLAAHARHRNLRGIRQHVGWNPNPRYQMAARPGMMREAAWRRGYALLARHRLSFDLQAFHQQVDEAVELCRDFPDVPVILGNLLMPVEHDAESRAAWRRALARLAGQPNTTMKLSGIGMVDHDWTVPGIAATLRDALAAFGPDRCLFASNFPVDRLFSSYARRVGAVREIFADLPPAALRHLFHDSACRVYRL